jgi:hypothetical protein
MQTLENRHTCRVRVIVDDMVGIATLVLVLQMIRVEVELQLLLQSSFSLGFGKAT